MIAVHFGVVLLTADLLGARQATGKLLRAMDYIGWHAIAYTGWHAIAYIGRHATGSIAIVNFTALYKELFQNFLNCHQRQGNFTPRGVSTMPHDMIGGLE